jgi:hypothetical protein
VRTHFAHILIVCGPCSRTPVFAPAHTQWKMDVRMCSAHLHQKSLSASECVKISAPALVRAHAQTYGLLTHIPRFSLKLMKNSIQSSFIHFGQIWSNLMKKEIIIFILMLQSTMYSTELHISSKSNSFVILRRTVDCRKHWLLKSTHYGIKTGLNKKPQNWSLG